MSFVAVVLLAAQGYAAITLEANYNVDQNLNIGSPSGGTLLGTANVSNGMLNTNAAPDGVIYGYTRNYLDITDGVSWGNNTIVAVITLDADAYPYDNLLGSGGGYNPDNRDGIKFYAHVPTWPGPALALHNDDGGPINIAMVGVNLGAQYQLSTGKEYFLAASWRDDGATISMRMYLREMGDILGTSVKYTSNTQTDPGGPSGFVRLDGYDQSLYVGRSFSNDPIDGGVDMVRIYNNFTDTQNDFAAVYTSVIPEPATLTVFALGSIMYFSRRNRTRTE